jgi:two-component system chemotaxis response regulator CheY
MRMLIKNILEKNGLQVIGEAENGLAGVNLYRELRPDLVTMDITMPVLDGIQALKHILELDPNASVVMVSSMGQDILVEEAINSGAKSFLVKPFRQESIANMISNLR